MRSSVNKNLIRVVSLLLAILFSVMAFAACADSVKDPIMECGDSKIGIEMYEFMLARMRGVLARSGYDVEPTSEFWSKTHAASGLTNEEYYNKLVADNCKNYLAALAIFDAEGMELPESTLQAIEEEVDFYVQYDGQGSVEKLDLILSKYGTDTEGLRKIYEIEAKYNAVITKYYGAGASQISGAVKDPYYLENYYRFKQILISNYYYEYITDESGVIMQFSQETGKPVYDSKGEYRYDKEGKRIVDSYGVAIRYDKEGKILYDTENGRPAPKMGEDNQPIEHKFTEAQMAERVAKIDGIISAAANGNYSAFEAEMPNWEPYIGAGEYCPDGYYLSDIESSIYDEGINAILKELKEMDFGEVRVVESENGHHIIMKYQLDAGKYEDGEYSVWFTEFNQSLVNKLFYDKCKQYFDKIEVDEDMIAKATSIKSLGSNFDY